VKGRLGNSHEDWILVSDAADAEAVEGLRGPSLAPKSVVVLGFVVETVRADMEALLEDLRMAARAQPVDWQIRRTQFSAPVLREHERLLIPQHRRLRHGSGIGAQVQAA
jgi:hypothetical protein